MIPVQLEEVRGLVRHSIETSSLGPLAEELGVGLDGGKMLRSRLLLRVATATRVPLQNRLHAAAAVEMVHAASLLHDDVIDGGRLRRGKPALWLEKGVKAAILLGDLLVCRAISQMALAADISLVTRLVDFADEMCGAELEQELLLRDRMPDWETCVGIARRKTGSMFAFAAEAGAGAAEPLRTVLREAGYAVGTAYQLADDMLDAYGDPLFSDKTLRGDMADGKVTAAAVTGADPVPCIRELCDSARASLSGWRNVQQAWDDYMAEDMRPVLDGFLESVRPEMVL